MAMWLPITLWVLATWLTCLAICVVVRASYNPEVPFWRLPAVLLDWQFSPAWPRMAALGACAVVGFFVGIAGVDRQIDGYDTASPPNISAMFDSEPLSGWQ